jgi:hypothetical protein
MQSVSLSYQVVHIVTTDIEMVKVMECVKRTEFATAVYYENRLHFTLDLTRHSPKESHNSPSIVYECTTAYRITRY